MRSKKKKRRKKKKKSTPSKTHHGIYSSLATATNSRRRATKHVPRVSPYSPASIDPVFVEIGLVQLSQSVKRRMLHTLTHTDRLRVVINYFEVLFFFRVFTENSRISAFCLSFCSIFSSSAKYLKIISRIADKSLTKQNIVQAHGMSRVRRVSPLPTVRDRPGSSPASFPGHGWSQKAPCITRAHFVQSTEPTHRHGQINTNSPAILLSWTALSRDKLSKATLARHGRPSRSQGTSSSTIKRIPSARASGFDDPIRCTSVATS